MHWRTHDHHLYPPGSTCRMGIAPHATYEIGSLVGEGAHHLVNFGLLVSLAEYFVLHRQPGSGGPPSSWKRWLSFLLAVGFVNLLDAATAKKAMILVMLRYVINGIKVNAMNAGKI